ncbi:MAG: 50S ribosomal protein L9 [Planctomycetota bacterium]|jgi:large subunit ribosomal protein L9|nr:50S ribosomal protein L9 [Planctomycetota bacterium]
MPMKLLLSDDVDNLGLAGEVVTVANGYGRNYLLPRRLAVAVTPENLRRIEEVKRLRKVREVERVKDLRTLAERIAALDITIRERVSETDVLYGSVGIRQVGTALAAEGIQVEDSMIRLAEPIKTLGVHRVSVRLHPEVEAELKIWVVGIKENAPIE